ncbi:MAG TPA: choice-of-anchor J domain-containing protein, partial [Chitinophagales bacterium]|nr:choice-of-anchor J domain-containing protein [Chitinophagales bacterium]
MNLNLRKIKAITLTMMAVLLTVGFSFAQNLSEGFEGTDFPPAGWKVINGGGPTTWVRYTLTPNTGTACAAIQYSSVAHNDWLITPKLRPESGNTNLAFWAKNSGTYFIDEFNVMLSTTGNDESDFTIVLASNIGPGDVYTEYTYDLSAYVGQDVYVAIQAISTDQFRLFVDDFTGPALAPPDAPLAAVIGLPLNGGVGIPISTSLSWDRNPAGDAPDGYRVYFGTDNPPTNIENGVDVGNVLSYTPAAVLEYATEYFWQIVPYNVTGEATGIATWSFTTSLGVGTLEGYVTNGFGIPMGGVEINIDNTLTNYTVTSEPNGFYQFELVPAADYTLTASIAGYNNTVLNVFVEPATTTYQNFSMLRPSMAVTPNPYSVAANPNEYVDGAINIANNGDGVLTWNATVAYTSPGPDAWLTVGTTNGTVPAYTNYNMPLAFNATGLAAGTVKTAEVTFTSTPDVGTVVVPVTMTVGGTAINVPFDLTADLTNPVDGVVTLNWSYGGDRSFLYFVVKRDGTQVGVTNNMTFTETLPAYGVYSYTVQAVFDEGNSAPAGPVTIEWANPTLVLNPTSLYNEQYPNTSEGVTFRVSNTGEGTLAFSFPEYAARQLVNSPSFTPNVRSMVEPVAVEKGEADPTDGMGNRNLRGAGGPDA